MTVELSLLPWPAAIVGADGKLRHCNQKWMTRFGRCDELKREFPEAAEKLRHLIAQAKNYGASHDVSSLIFRILAPGEIAPLRLRFAKINDAHNYGSLWLMMVLEDLHEYRDGEREGERDGEWLSGRDDNRERRDAEIAMDGVAMRVQARHWRAFFHNAAAGKALIGLHGETLEVNDALCQLIGRSEQQLLNLYARDLHHPDDQGSVESCYQSVLNGGPPLAGIEARYLHKDGHYLNCLLSLSIIRDSRQRPLYFATEIENVTSRHRAEALLREQAQQLKRANRDLKRSNADLERFAFVASHDLQEPLRKIRVFGDRLQMLVADAPAESDLQRYIRVMTRSAERMHNLVNDLLAYGRLKNRDASFVAVDLNRLWAELSEEFEAALCESGGQLHVGDLPVVHGNRSRLYQLFGNLLSNSLKFRGDSPPLITVRAFNMPNAEASETDALSPMVSIEVEDNGIGFDQQQAEAIFDVFTRLHGQSRYDGTGIGLAICRRVAREHGGDVFAFSHSATGARFIVTLSS